MKGSTRPRDSSARMEEMHGGLERALMVSRESGAVVCPIQNGLWSAAAPPMEMLNSGMARCLVVCSEKQE